MAKVSVREGEIIERALRRFKRKVEQSGVLKLVRKQEYYLKPSQQRKIKKRAAEARARKRQRQSRHKAFV